MRFAHAVLVMALLDVAPRCGERRPPRPPPPRPDEVQTVDAAAPAPDAGSDATR
jgi:hypothetical protein